jgi:DNA-binding SARP family transcriptional activator
MEFRILGPLEVRHDGRPLPCKGAKQRLLLSVLLLRSHEVVSRDTLIDALWGERPPPTAPKALQMHISQLRRLLDTDVLVTRPPGYQLDIDGHEFDLRRFEGAVAKGRTAAAAGRPEQAASLLAKALALWRGPPLADLTFEDSLQPEIARLEELRMTAVEDRVDADLELGRHAELIAELEQLTAQQPLRERIRGQLMLALYRSGRQADALDVYADTRRRLVEDLGLEPGRDLKLLQQRVLAQDAALDPPPRAAVEPPATGGLLGRKREFGDLAAAIDHAVAGRGAVVLIGGEPGIGKSRLAESLARHADAAGARVAVGRCWEAGGAPAFWPWVQALRTVVRDSDLDTITDLAGASEHRDEEGARFRMFDSITALLRAAASDTPVALFLDDLHAADAASLLLLRFVAADVAYAPIAVVGCYRNTEVGPELAEAIAELSREPVVTRVSLEGLDASATSSLLAAAMGAPPPDDLVERVQMETRGNPLFAGELGRLFATDGVPAEAGERLPIPEAVREAIQRRLQRQSERCRDVLGLASVAGREFDVPLLATVSGLTEAELAGALAEALAARVIGELPGTSGRLRFSHILVRDALYGDLPRARRIQLHRAVAQALAELYAANPGPHLAAIAHHYFEAGPAIASAAIDYARRAGDYAASQYAYEDAARHYRNALTLLQQGSVDEPATTCDVLLSLGESLSRAGDSAEAKEVLREAAALAEANRWPGRLARAALGYGGRFAWIRGSTDPVVVPLLERALASIGAADPLTRARLLARLAAAVRDDPARERRVALAQEALDITRTRDDLVARAYAVEGYWIATEGPDALAEGIVVGDELIALGSRIGDREHQFTGRDFRLNAFWKLADRAGVDVELDVLSNLAEELRQPSWRWWVRTTRTMVTLMEGHFDEAEELIRDTRTFGEQAERWNAHVSERLQLFVLRRAQGRLAELEDTVARSVHEYPSLLRFGAAQAHLHAELGDAHNARNAFDALLARDLVHEHVDAEWLFTIALLPDPCRFLGDQDAAATLYALLLPYAADYAQAPVEASFGSTARALGVLATVLRQFDDAERHFDTALEIERRMRARPWLAHALHDYAAMLVARGDRERAAALLREAVATYEKLGMNSWAGRARALASS